MNRRETVFALIALGAAPSALAQSASSLPRIAVVDGAEVPANMAEGRHPLWGSFLSELRRLGYVEGKTIIIERWSGGSDTGGYSELMRKVVASKPRVIFARGRSVAVQLAAATRDIPIVMIGTVSKDLSTSMARPSGNVTGLNTSADDQQIYGKQMDFLGDLTKPGARLAWLGPKLIWDAPAGAAARQGAIRSKLLLKPVFVSNPISTGAIKEAFAAIKTGRFDGLLVSPSTEIFPHRALIAQLALEARLPAMGNQIPYVEAGLLASYGAAFEESYARAAHYVDRILKGAKSGDLPIEQPTTISLVFNLKTAKALGMAIPESLLLRADRVIE